MTELLRILAVAGRQWPWMASGVIVGTAVIAANALLMAISGWFIASMAVAGTTGALFNYFIPAAAIRAFAILRTVGRYCERLVTHEAALRVLADLRVWFFSRLVPLAPALLERYTTGDVAGRLRSDIDALESLYLRILLPLATGGTSLLLAGLFVANWSRSAASALMLFLLCAGVILPLFARRLATEPGQRAARLAGDLRAEVTEGLQGGEELLLLGAVEIQSARVELLSAELVAEQYRLSRISGLIMAGGIVCGGFGTAAVFLFAGSAVAAGELAGPLLVMLILFAAATFEAASGIPAALQQAPSALESVRRIRDLADAPLPVPDPAIPLALPSELDIVFSDVSFAYDPAVPVLDRFSLHIAQGDRVALAGPSGVGKSSVAELLLRFRPYTGSITIGGTELREMAADDLRRLISVVPQRPHLFDTTIRGNILLANPGATDDQLHRALEDASLADWVASLPDGLETRAGEGGCAVSGGEARRIALARALLQDAQIVILDEPTEGLDLATERSVVLRLAARLQGKSVLIITHRPACLELARTVVWMKPLIPGNTCGNSACRITVLQT